MKKTYTVKAPLIVIIGCLLFISACKKDSKTPPNGTPVKIGLYEQGDSIIYKLLLMPITKIGTQTLPDSINALVFDTGSGGMVIDASGVLPASMITSSGFNFTTDSLVINGITITNQTSTIEYGDDASTDVNVYGNLAYASVVIGETSGNLTIKRLPFFLYYKAIDAKGNKIPPHQYDVFGVDPEYDITFSNNVAIESPFMYYDPGNNLTKGFKMPALGTSNFNFTGDIPITPGVVTVGLTSSDISISSGYTFSTLQTQSAYGASPVIQSTITYNGTPFSAYVVFDSGTDPYNYIENNAAAKTVTQLPSKTAVSVKTESAFTYPFTITDSDYLTFVENPSTSKTDVSILSLEYFLNNEYLLDYPDHKIGLKNN